MKRLLVKFKAWRKRRYWAARHLAFLQGMIREDWRWLASVPGAEPFLDRYHRAASESWHQLVHQSAHQFRASFAKSSATQWGEKEFTDLILQRERLEKVIDALCDAALGEDRTEWSSAYYFEDAISDVQERIGALEAAAEIGKAMP